MKLLRLVLLFTLVSLAFGQSQAPPTTFVQPVSLAGMGPNGFFARMGVDPSGDLNVTGSTYGIFAQIGGYVQPFAPVAQDSTGAWHYLQVDASGNLKTSGSGGGSVSLTIGQGLLGSSNPITGTGTVSLLFPVDGSYGYTSGDPCVTITSNITAAILITPSIKVDLSGFGSQFTNGIVPCNSNPFENKVFSGLIDFGPVTIVTSRAWLSPGANQRVSFKALGTSDVTSSGPAAVNGGLFDCTAQAPAAWNWDGTKCTVNGIVVPTLANGGGHSVTFTYPHGAFGAGTYYPLLWLGGQGAGGINLGGTFGADISDMTVGPLGAGGADFAIYTTGIQEQSFCKDVTVRGSNSAGFFYDRVQGTATGPSHFGLDGCTARMDASQTATQGYPNVATQKGMGYGIFYEGNADVVYFTGGTCTVYPQGYPATFGAGGKISTIKMTYAGTCSNVTGLTCHIGSNRGTGETCAATTSSNTVTGITSGGVGSGYGLGDTMGGGPFQILNATINGSNTTQMQEGVVLDGVYSSYVRSLHGGYDNGYTLHVGYGSGAVVGGIFENIDLENTSQGVIHFGVGIDKNQTAIGTGKGGSVNAIQDDVCSDSQGANVPTEFFVPCGFPVENAGLLDQNQNPWIQQTAVASAVDGIIVANAATGGTPSILASGSDTDIPLTVGGQGAGNLNLNGPNATAAPDGTINSAVGFQIGTAAPLGHTPTGDGARYVDATPGVAVDATNPATLLAGNRLEYLYWTSGSSQAWPAIAGSFANNFVFNLPNKSGGTLTFTPNAAAGDLCNGAATCPLLNNWYGTIHQDSTAAPGHWFIDRFPTLGAFPSACGDTGGNHLNFTAAGGITCGTSGSGITSFTYDIPFWFANVGVLTGQTVFNVVTHGGTITGINWLTDVSGNATIDVLTKTVASYHTNQCTGATDIANGGVTMTTDSIYQNTTLTSWTTTVTATAAAPIAICIVLSAPASIHTLAGKITLTGTN